MPIRPDDTIRCSFCGRTQDQVRKMIAGSGNHNVFICDECIELCSEILEEELGKQEEEDVEEEAPLFNDIHLLKPKEIKAFLDEYELQKCIGFCSEEIEGYSNFKSAGQSAA